MDKRLVLIVAMVMMVSCGVRADWPQYLGPNRNATSRGGIGVPLHADDVLRDVSAAVVAGEGAGARSDSWAHRRGGQGTEQTA